VKLDQALLRIPNLAIHLQTADERVAFKLNKENHLSPILATSVKKVCFWIFDQPEQIAIW